MRTARTHVSGLVVAALLLVSCGGDDERAADSVALSIASTTAATVGAQTTEPSTTGPSTTEPATIAPATAAPATSVPATAVVVTTTPAPTSIVTLPATEVLPQPIAVPADSGGMEPVVEVGSVHIPALGIHETMYEGIRLTTLDRGPGHWPGTAMPGQVGNVVVAGHRVSHSKPFRNIDKLVAGDQVVFDTADGHFVYTVAAQEIVEPDALYIVDQTPAKTATLFACHPPGSTRQRIVVHLVLDETAQT